MPLPFETSDQSSCGTKNSLVGVTGECVAFSPRGTPMLLAWSAAEEAESTVCVAARLAEECLPPKPPPRNLWIMEVRPMEKRNRRSSWKSEQRFSQ